MRKGVIFVLLGMLISACAFEPENNFPQILTTLDEVEELISTETVAVSPPEPTPTTTPEVSTCKLAIRKIADSVYRFSWDKKENVLYYTQDREMLKWKTYPDALTSMMVQEVYPILNDQVKEWIQFSNFIPIYSVSPSGEKVIFWEHAYTRPTPTPAGGEVSLTNFEWLQNIYLLSDEYQSPHLVTTVEGEIDGIYWSVDEETVFLVFEQIQIPGENFVVKINLARDSQEVIRKDAFENLNYSWIALSPDQKWMVSSYRVPVMHPNTEANLTNLLSNEIRQITNLPDFYRIIWINDFSWLLINQTEAMTNFTLMNISTQEIIDSYFVEEQVENIWFEEPQLSPARNQIAFVGINPTSNDFALYSLSLCATE